MSETPRILYCHCQYAQIIPKEVKEAVLQELCAAGRPFDAVPDLCELAARRDPALRKIAEGEPVKIVACFPRAVRWLFHQAGAPLEPHSAQVLNMRTETAEAVVGGLLSPQLEPNLPTGKPTPSDAPRAAAAA